MRCLFAIVCSVGFAALLAVPAAASNDDEQQQQQQQQTWAAGKQLTESIAAAHKTATPYIDQSDPDDRVGFDEGICIRSASLLVSEEVSITRKLEKNEEYAFAAGSDASVKELVMTLSDPSGKTVRAEQDDAVPSFRYKPTKTGEHTLTVRLAEIDPARALDRSYVTVVFLRKGGYEVAPEDVRTATRLLGIGCTEVNQAASKKARLLSGRDQWCLFGAALEPDEEATESLVSLGKGDRMLLAVGDSNAEDVDVMVLSDDGDVLLRDKSRKPFAFLKFTEDENTSRSIRIKNVKSKRGKRTMILSAILKLDP